MTQHDDITGGTTGLNQQPDLHQAVAELQQAVGELQHAIDLGESMVQAAVRETKEESGIDCEITGLVGIYTDPNHVTLYTSNREVR